MSPSCASVVEPVDLVDFHTASIDGELWIYLPEVCKGLAQQAHDWAKKHQNSEIVKYSLDFWEINKRIATGMPLTVHMLRRMADFVGEVQSTRLQAARSSQNPWAYPSYIRHMAMGGSHGIEYASRFLGQLGPELSQALNHYPGMEDSAFRGDASTNSQRCGESTIEAGEVCTKPIVSKTIKTERGLKRTPNRTASEAVMREREKAIKRLREEPALKRLMSGVLSGNITTVNAAVNVLSSSGDSEISKLKGKIEKALNLRKGESLKQVLMGIARSGGKKR
jgi:hypothetical protein